MAVEFAQLTHEEDKAIDRIVERAKKEIGSVMNEDIDGLSLRMDLSAIHYHTPLELVGLSNTDRFNFAHDVYGIMRCIDRSTGQLTNHFLPRFSKL